MDRTREDSKLGGKGFRHSPEMEKKGEKSALVGHVAGAAYTQAKKMPIRFRVPRPILRGC